MGDEVAGKRALNVVLNEVLNGWCWRQKKGCPKVPISLLFGGAKNGQKWGCGDSWGGQMGGQFEQATTPLREKIEAKNAKNGQKHTL